MHFPKKIAILQLMKRAFFTPFILLLIGVFLSALTFISPYYPENLRGYWVVSADFGNFIIAFAGILFVYKFLVVLCTEYEKWLTNRNRRVASMVVSIMRRGLRIIYFLVAIQLIVSFLGLSEFYLRIFRKSIDVILIGSVGWIFLQVITTTEVFFYQYSLETTHPDIQRRKGLYTKVHLIKNTLTIAIIVLTFAAMLMVFDSFRSIGVSLLASAGFLTAIIGLAAQRTLSSMFSGIQIALSQPIKIDDVIMIDNNRGIIEEITLSYVALKLTNLRRMVIPISYFIDKPFLNLSRTQSNLIDTFNLYVDYLLPVASLREQFNHILSHSSYWDKKIAVLQVSGVTDNSVELALTVSAADADQLSFLRAEVLEKILEYIRANYPSYFPQKRVGLTQGEEVGLVQSRAR